MYVCLCRAVSEAELSELARQSGGCLKRVQDASGAGTDCGSCIGKVEAIVAGRPRPHHGANREHERAKIPARK